MEDVIKRFLQVPGYGFDSGYGYGSGDGDGYGSGDGSGDGSGIKTYDGRPVYYIDDVPTLLDSIHRNYAKGFIVNRDLTLTPTFVAKCGRSFAHAATLHDAVREAQEKELEECPIEERIERFQEEHPDLDTPYGDLFQWHHILTGSCTQGREEWCQAHGYKPTDCITIRTFIEQTRHDYGGEVINQLAEAYGIEKEIEL